MQINWGGQSPANVLVHLGGQWPRLLLIADRRKGAEEITDMTKRKRLDLDAMKARLELERASLLEVSDSAAEERRPVELDQQSVGRLSRMDALQVQAMAQAVEARRRARLQRIDAALKRLESGDYGYCLSCDEDIPVKRLEVDPATDRCIDCSG